MVLGFMIAYSYNLTKEYKEQSIGNKDWDDEYELREEYIKQEEMTRELQKEVIKKQERIADYENSIAEEEEILFNLAEDIEKYRMFLGKVKVSGEGVEVTLSDNEYNPSDPNVNNYIVHEHHVFNLINELLISGAEAVAVNGQRLTHTSYIYCNGPVITIDGRQHPAPFTISAIGDADVLESALLITGGVRDQLVNENILFTLEQKKDISLEPIVGS